jgi:hypothetical protein
MKAYTYKSTRMRHSNILWLFLVVLGLSGCKKLLTLTPEDTLNPENYFSNAKELQLWTNQFYSLMENADAQAGQNADDHVDNALGEIITGQRDAASENGWTFSTLRKINYYLQNSANCQDAAARKQYDGVAYFMRAFFYFDKVREYGDVPWYSQVLASDDDALLFKPRDSRELVMDSVMMDLDRAIQMLPVTKSKFVVSKWTALALKSRVALYEGSFRKYHGMSNADKYLEQAAAAGADFIQNSGYKLYTTGTEPYRNLFNTIDALTDEVILAKVHSTATNLTHGIPFAINNGKQGFTKRFMNHYLMADGSRYTSQAGWETRQFAAETQSRDPRLKQTVLSPGYIQKGATATTINKLVAVTGYQPIKFVAEVAYDGASKAITDWPLFRTAEVYLNYAEAKAELGSLTQNDLDISVNKIRSRAAMPAMTLAAANSNTDPLLLDYYPNVTKSANTGVILEIRRERTVELVMEGFRQWDLFRWKEGKKLTEPFLGCYFPGPGRYDMNNDGVNDLVLWVGTRETITGGTSKEIGVDIILSEGTSGYIVAYPTIKTTWNENRDYLWPIPTSERVLTGGKLTQNPGWTDSSGF